MKNIIIGTAGHIDHGKTTLIKALTGRNTDRWKEEQERGITIDLGFTWFDMKNGDRAGIIDVPGHEKFIRNMVAGVVGMDLVILVVAADEGIMPQTREHMDILGLLGIEKSIVVLNKCDIVEEEWLDLIEEEIHEEFAGTFLESAPIVRVSAAKGEGLDELQNEIIRMTRTEVVEREIQTIPRLPIDRVFTLAGFGTIVTGTLISGTISKDETLEMYPIGKECKIRNIQVHGKDTAQCLAGQRVAINLSNIKKSEIFRGCVMAPPDSMRISDMLDVKISILPDSQRLLQNRDRLHLYTGTSEVLCRAILLDKDEIGSGEDGLAQLLLEDKIALKRGDRFVVRFYSPLETIGGGIILEPNPKKKRRFDENAIRELEKKESGSLADVMELHIREYSETMITLAELARVMAHSTDELAGYVAELEEKGAVTTFAMKKELFLWHTESQFAAGQKIRRELQGYHEKYPYRRGKKKSEIRNTYLKLIKPVLFDLYLERMEKDGVFKREGEYLCLPDFKILKDENYRMIEDTLLTTFRKAGYDFVYFSEIDLGKYPFELAEDVIAVLQEEGTVIRLADNVFTLTSLAEQAKQVIQDLLQQTNVITIGQVRDSLGNSRKNAKIMIDHTDGLKITKKVGGESERVAY